MHGVGVAHGLEPPPETEVRAFFAGRIEQQTDVYGVWVAEHEGVVAGWEGLQPCRPNPISRWAESSTYIASNSKARGVGRALIGYVLDHARRVELQYVVGFIKTGNDAAIRIVESAGWCLVGALPRAKANDPQYLYYAYAVPLGHAHFHEVAREGVELT